MIIPLALVAQILATAVFVHSVFIHLKQLITNWIDVNCSLLPTYALAVCMECVFVCV